MPTVGWSSAWAACIATFAHMATAATPAKKFRSIVPPCSRRISARSGRRRSLFHSTIGATEQSPRYCLPGHAPDESMARQRNGRRGAMHLDFREVPHQGGAPGRVQDRDGAPHHLHTAARTRLRAIRHRDRQGGPSRPSILSRYRDDKALADHRASPSLPIFRPKIEQWAEIREAKMGNVWTEIKA